MEGVQLQLKGRLEEAVEKYRQSLALKPNDKLEALVRRLEKHAGRTAVQAGSTAADTPADTTTPVQEAAAGPAVRPAEEAGQKSGHTERTRPEVVHQAASTEEQQVFDFVDRLLNNLSALADDGVSWLETDYDYQVTRSSGKYIVRLDPFNWHIDEGKQLNMGPIVLSFQPAAANRLQVEVALPQHIPLLKFDEPWAELTVGERRLAGTWNPKEQTFRQFDMLLDDILLKKLSEPVQLKIRRITASSNLEADGQKKWKQVYAGSLQDATLEATGGKLSLRSIELTAGEGGKDLETFQQLRRRFAVLADLEGQDLDQDRILEESKKLLAAVDRLVQLFDSSESRLAVRGFTGSIPGFGDFGLDSLLLNGSMVKNATDGRFDFNNNGALKGISFTGAAGEKEAAPLAVTIGEISLDNNLRINPVPPTLFADLQGILSKALAMENEEEDKGLNYLRVESIRFGQRLLGLIGGGSGSFTLAGLEIDNLMPQPVRLDKTTFSAGFAADGEQGGSVLLTTGFSGFTGVELGDDIVPRSAAFNLKIAGIPPLVSILGDPAGMIEEVFNRAASGEEFDVDQAMDQVQERMTMNAMNVLMSSGLSLSIPDSFITFPTSRIGLDLKADLDGNAAYMATGNLRLAIENPDKIREMVSMFASSPEIPQILATFTALANRTTEKGKTVDRIDARLTPEGRIMINSKDVTDMFISQTPAEQPVGPDGGEKGEGAPATVPQG